MGAPFSEMPVCVSIVIPCFNSADCIARSILSSLAQTYANCDICVIDDGSTDGSLSIIRSFGGRIRWETGPNRGAPHARNRGLELAHGEYIQFLDADDVLEPSKIQHQMDLICQAGTPIDMVVGASKRIYIDNRVELLSPASDPWVGLIQTRLGITSANLFRRAALLGVGGWNENLKSSQEYELMFRLLKARASVVSDPEPLTLIYQRDGSISNTNKAGNWLRYVELRREIWQHLESRQILTDGLREMLLEFLFLGLRNLYRHCSKEACALHGQLFSRGYAPKCCSLPYRALYRVFGFRAVQRIVQCFGK